PGGVSLLAVFVWWWGGARRCAGSRPLASVAAIGVAGLTFLIVCPGVWADSERFWRHFWYEVRHVGQGHGAIFTDTGLGWLYHIRPNLSVGFGAAGLIASLAGWLFYRRERALWGVGAATAAYYLLIGAAEVRFLRYTFPLFPALAIGVGLLWASDAPRLPRWSAPTLASLALAWQLVSAISLTACMLQPDARDQAAQWARVNLPEGARIGFPTVPWFYTPPLFPETGELRWQDRLMYAQNAPRYRLIPLAPPEWNAEALQAALPEYLILTEFETRDVQRIGRADYQAFMRVVQDRYTHTHTFTNEPPLLRRPANFPHDLLYICPTVSVYQLR
ncbi:MAG: hypothetical protein ACK4ME_11990, partial [Fimbriimonadales bacterium]